MSKVKLRSFCNLRSFKGTTESDLRGYVIHYTPIKRGDNITLEDYPGITWEIMSVSPALTEEQWACRGRSKDMKKRTDI